VELMPASDALILLVIVPLLAACLAVVASERWRMVAAAGPLLALPLLLARLTQVVLADGVLEVALAGYAPPVGIRLRVDGLALVLLWLVALIGGAAGMAAISSHPPASRAGGRFWPLWLLMLAGLNALFLSADLFSIYVALELVGLSAIALIAADGQPDALRAAMRYLLLAMLASLAYLLGVALLYGEHGTLDLYLLATEVGGSGSAGTLPALSLITVGLLLKAAVFPLHVWLPAAHSQAPGAVSAVLSGLVVKTAIYLLYRLWFWTAEGLDLTSAAFLLGLIGASAILYGSLAALVQVQLKRVVAYSTVAQLGYLMLVFPLFGDPRAASSAWTGTGCQLFAHGLAKAGMFLAAAGLVQGMGSGRLDRLAGADRRQPACLFAFGLAGVSLMGLPPSAGFLAKWQLLESAWMQSAWGWVAVLLTGSLLAAGYIFRVLAAAFVAPSAGSAGPASAAHEPACPPAQRVSLFLSLPALALALASVLFGFWAAPLLEMMAVAPPALLDPLLPSESRR
jgi:formate hydrogenlyase subunit 3/multisubunit Na+/H+ antiporter MnhD subunit